MGVRHAKGLTGVLLLAQFSGGTALKLDLTLSTLLDPLT